MRSVTVPAILVLCLGGIAMAKAPPAQAAPASGQSAPSANYHPQVSPEIAALQAQERVALARGDVAGARELEKQVQATLIEQQRVVPQSVPVVVVGPPSTGKSLTADQLICSGPVTASAADWDTSGTMWAAFAAASDSTIRVYRSTDHGVSWDIVINGYLSPKHYINKIELVVGEGDSGFVYVFDNVPTNNGDLMMVRCGRDGSGAHGFSVHAGADSITDFTACRDFSGSNYWLYAVAHNGAEPGQWPRSFLLRSMDYGKTWAVTDSVYNLARPRLAFGAGTYGYLSAVPDQAYWSGLVAVAVTPLSSSPGTWHFSGFDPDALPVDDACIAPAFTTPPESAITWIAYSHYNSSGNWDVLSGYALGDTQLLWNGPYAVANTGHDERAVDLKNFTVEGNPYVNVSFCDIGPTLLGNAWLGYSSAGSPTVWTALSDTWVNKTASVGWDYGLFPRIVYSPGGPGSGGGLVFVDMGGVGYFNAPWFTGVAENPAQPERPGEFSVLPSVARGPVRVTWSGRATRLVVTDVAGRVVRSVSAPAGNSFVWNPGVPAGTYLVCLATSSGTTTRLVVIQ